MIATAVDPASFSLEVRDLAIEDCEGEEPAEPPRREKTQERYVRTATKSIVGKGDLGALVERTSSGAG